MALAYYLRKQMRGNKVTKGFHGKEVSGHLGVCMLIRGTGLYISYLYMKEQRIARISMPEGFFLIRSA